MPDDELSAIIAKGIAQGMSDEDIKLVAQEHARRKSGLTDSKTGTEYQPGAMVRLPPKGARVVSGPNERGNYLVQGPNWLQERADPSRNPELSREDNSVLGLPPELAAVSAAGVTRAVTSAAGGAATKLAAGAKEVASQATPAIKYEVTKSTLEHFGVPPLVAMPIAMAVSGYKRSPRTTASTVASESATAAAPTAAPVEDAMTRTNRVIDEAKAQPVPLPTLVKPETAAATAPKSSMSAAAIADKLQQAAAKARVDLSPSEHVTAFRLVRDEGVSAADAVAKVGGTPRPITVPAAGLNLTANEVKEYVRLVKAGKSQADAVAAIKTMRAFPGAMSTEQMESEIANRVGNRSPRR